jgi:hypothetical protein
LLVTCSQSAAMSEAQPRTIELYELPRQRYTIR